jgi:hypothetical protein
VAIAWVDGADNAATPGTSCAVTMPGDVAAGDVVLLFAASIGLAGSSVAFTSSGATSPSAIANVLSANFSSTPFVYSVWYFVAASGDVGATITLRNNDGSSSYMAAILGAYSGASATQPDVIAHNDTGASVSATYSSPTAVTGANADWAVNYAFAAGGVDITSVPQTTREAPAGYSHALSDSNGSVGSAGTSIGDQSWAADSTTTWSSFTIGLQPSGGGVPHTATGALTVAPSLTAGRSHGNARGAALTVRPAFANGKAQAHVRGGSLTVRPAIAAATEGGAVPLSSVPLLIRPSL